MQSNVGITSRRNSRQMGLTLLELIFTITILLILSTAAFPLVRLTIVRQKEWELRRDLREMRTAIDRYKDFADKNLIQSEVGSEGYPADLNILVKGVQFSVAGAVNMRFLRRIPIDPMTGRPDWVLRSMQEDPDSDEHTGLNVFDVHSNSRAIALDGTAYSKW